MTDGWRWPLEVRRANYVSAARARVTWLDPIPAKAEKPASSPGDGDRSRDVGDAAAATMTQVILANDVLHADGIQRGVSPLDQPQPQFYRRQFWDTWTQSFSTVSIPARAKSSLENLRA